MSWMTPALSADIARSLRLGSLRLVRDRFTARVAEQFLEPMPALLESVERQPKVGDRVADYVEARLAVHLDKQPALVADRLQATAGELRGEQVAALIDLDQQELACLGERADRVGPQQPASVERDKVVADLLDLAKQVRRDQDRKAELGADPGDQVEHRRPACRVEPVGRLVE